MTTTLVPLAGDIKRTPDGHPIPPKWINVKVATSRGNYLQATGLDSAGRKVYIYSVTHKKRSDSSKFNRLKSFMRALPGMVQRIEKDSERGIEEAQVLRLIYKTGFRVGSMSDTKAKVQAYGASTLLGRHVSIKGNLIHFDFIAKKGVRAQKTLKDEVLADKFLGKHEDESLFDTTYGDVNHYMDRLSKKFLVKDFRLYRGTRTAIDTLKKLPIPVTIKEYKQGRNFIGDAVAKELGNTRSVALGSYIAPEVFEDWDEAVKDIRAIRASKQTKRKERK